MKEKKEFQMPNSFALLFIIIAVMAILIYLIPTDVFSISG